MGKTVSLEDRLWQRVNKNGPLRRPMKTQCWVWTGATQKGYGSIHIGPGRANKQMRRVHVITWEWINGPVPDGLTLDHLCRNRTCVRPSHLEPVTGKVNTLRGRGPTAVNAAKTECKHGHRFTPENTRYTYVNNKYNQGWMRTCIQCSRDRAKKQRQSG